MLRIVLHALILPFMFWLEKRGLARLSPLRGALLWYALGVPFMAVEASASGSDWATVLLQSVTIALFFIPAAYFAFRRRRAKGGIWRPFLTFLLLSLLAGFVAAVVLARAPIVRGIGET